MAQPVLPAHKVLQALLVHKVPLVLMELLEQLVLLVQLVLPVHKVPLVLMELLVQLVLPVHKVPLVLMELLEQLVLLVQPVLPAPLEQRTLPI
jgi:hypothetical protein